MRFFKILISVIFISLTAFTVYLHFSDDNDYSAPEIKCDTEMINVSVNDDSSELLKHVKASDKKDGDLTSSVVIESVSPFIKDKTANITFAVCDSDSNVSKLTVGIIYNDYVPPVFKITKQQTYYVGASKVDLLDGVTASDLLEGDVSSRITVADADIDLSTPGVYPIKYRVTTSLGAVSELPVNVYVYESRLQASIDLKSYLVYTEKNGKINPNSYIDSYPKEYLEDDYFDGYICKLGIKDETDYSKPGTYTVTYRLNKNPKNNEKGKAEILAESYLTVVVKE